MPGWVGEQPKTKKEHQRTELNKINIHQSPRTAVLNFVQVAQPLPKNLQKLYPLICNVVGFKKELPLRNGIVEINMYIERSITTPIEVKKVSHVKEHL